MQPSKEKRSNESNSEIGRSSDRHEKRLAGAVAMPIVIDTFARMTGYPTGEPGGGTMLWLTYLEYALTLFFFANTCGAIARTGNDMSTKLHGVLCLLIESVILLILPMRLYWRAEFREMYRCSRTVGIPDEHRSSIENVTRYHLMAFTVFITTSALYVVTSDSVRPEDPFTFPFLDVLPMATDNMTVYLCKYAVYTLPVFIAHVEICYLNVTFVCSVGVIKQYSTLIIEYIEQALRIGDERKLKTAVVYHQNLLKYFKIMKSAYAAPILMTIGFCGIYFGLAMCLVIQAFKGYISKIILGLCLTSGMAAFMTILIYCISASTFCDLHKKILHICFDHRIRSKEKSFVKLILILMTRLTIPLEFTVASVCTTNLNLLVKIIKFSYTVLNVLLASLKRHNLI